MQHWLMKSEPDVWSIDQQKNAGKQDVKQNQDSKNKDQNKENVVDADFEEVKEDKNDKDKEKRA